MNKIDCGQVKRIQMDGQSRIPQFLQKKVDVVNLYVNNDLPILEVRIGTKFPSLDLAKHGLNLLGLAAVSNDAVIARKPDVLRRYLAAPMLASMRHARTPRPQPHRLSRYSREVRPPT